MSDSTDHQSPSSPFPEIPFASDLLTLVESDLEASRGLVQRLSSVSDALVATMLTVAGLFVGLAYSGNAPALAYIAAPIVLTIGLLEATNNVHMRRVLARIRSLEKLLHAYVMAYRETGTVRDQAIDHLRDALDRYQFGTERTFRKPAFEDTWRTNRFRPRSWIFILVGLGCIVAGLVSEDDPASEPTLCIELADGVVVALPETDLVTAPHDSLVPCASPSPVPSSSTTSSTSVPPPTTSTPSASGSTTTPTSSTSGP